MKHSVSCRVKQHSNTLPSNSWRNSGLKEELQRARDIVWAWLKLTLSAAEGGGALKAAVPSWANSHQKTAGDERGEGGVQKPAEIDGPQSMAIWFVSQSSGGEEDNWSTSLCLYWHK